MKYYYPNKPNKIDPESPLFRQLDNDEQWIAEEKRNGWRCLVYKNHCVTLYTRHNTIINGFEMIKAEFEHLPDGTIIDGEIIHFRTKEYKEQIYLFDVIQVAYELVVNLPLIQRKAILDNLIPNKSIIAKMYYRNKVELFNNLKANELCEGIVIKKLDSKYLISETKCLINPFWIKVKKEMKNTNP